MKMRVEGSLRNDVGAGREVALDKQDQLQVFNAIAHANAIDSAPLVLAMDMSSADYDRRHAALADKRSMKEPRNYTVPHRGFLVLRNPGTSHAYETWVARHVFLRRYQSTSSQDAMTSECPGASDRKA